MLFLDAGTFVHSPSRSHLVEKTLGDSLVIRRIKGESLGLLVLSSAFKSNLPDVCVYFYNISPILIFLLGEQQSGTGTTFQATTLVPLPRRSYLHTFVLKGRQRTTTCTHSLLPPFFPGAAAIAASAPPYDLRAVKSTCTARVRMDAGQKII